MFGYSGICNVTRANIFAYTCLQNKTLINSYSSLSANIWQLWLWFTSKNIWHSHIFCELKKNFITLNLKEHINVIKKKSMSLPRKDQGLSYFSHCKVFIYHRYDSTPPHITADSANIFKVNCRHILFTDYVCLSTFPVLFTLLNLRVQYELRCESLQKALQSSFPPLDLIRLN